MEKQISFQGVSLNPYGDISPDGELSACVNLQSHGGALRPSELGGKEIITMQPFELLFIHATSEYRHMIFYYDTNLYWAEEQDVIKNFNTISDIQGNVTSVNASGNTLVVTTDSGIFYFLFKNNGYVDLGGMPELNISFSLRSAIRVEYVGIHLSGYTKFSKEDLLANNIPQDAKDVIIQSIKPVYLNMLEQVRKDGYFAYPFFVRYGFRLYDGTITKQSSPIFMPVVTGNNPLIWITEILEDAYSNVVLISCRVAVCVCALEAMVNTDKVNYSAWRDIIPSYCIALSSPIATSNQDFTDIKFSTQYNEVYSLSAFSNSNVESDKDKYKLYDLLYMYVHAGNGNDEPSSGMFEVYPKKSQSDIDDEIKECSVFYIALEKPNDSFNIPTFLSRVSVNFDSAVLKNLEFKERMPDDYLSHDKLFARKTFSYNQRVILYGLKRKVFSGFNTESLFCFHEDSSTLPSGMYKVFCYVYIKEGNKDIVVKNECKIDFEYGPFFYFFYPNVNAYKVVINYVFSNSENKSYVVNLTPHPLLNGAYAYDIDSTSSYVNPEISTDDDRIIDMPNTLYMSEVANPFNFSVKGIITIGTSEILGISSITTALSQGQFGSFPLMAFCTDGNYALQVNSEGLFSAVTPMQRDVCTNPKSITQIDGAIIFVTARGVMVADGSSIQPLSKILDGVQPDISQFASDAGLSEDLPIGIPSMPPVDFFQSCIIAYDYPNKRLLFMSESREDKAFGWQYCIDEQRWQQINFGNAYCVVNVFPSSYVQHTRYLGSFIKRLDKPYDYDAEGSNEGFILTRPLKLDSLQPKSISQIMLEGDFQKDSQKLVLFGSNDLKQWHRIASTTNRRMLLRGRYFKFYRIAVSTSLGNGENVSGLRVIYNVRPDYRLR